MISRIILIAVVVILWLSPSVREAIGGALGAVIGLSLVGGIIGFIGYWVFSGCFDTHYFSVGFNWGFWISIVLVAFAVIRFVVNLFI